MSFIVFMRNPSNRRLIFLSDDDGSYIAEFKTEDEANLNANKIKVCQAWGYEVLEVNG